MITSKVLDLNYLINSLETISCPICGCPESRKVYQGSARRGNIGLFCVICTYCAHLYLNPRPSLKAYTEFYRNDDYRRLTFRKTDYCNERLKIHNHNYFQERMGHGQRLYNEYLKNILKKDDIVFDFGAGDGAWLFGLRQLTGCKIDGNEPSLVDVQFIKEKMGLDIFSGPIEDVGDEIIARYKGKVKLAIVSGSLQHMLEPMRCLNIAWQILCPEGYLYICNIDLFDYLSFKRDNPSLFKEILTIDHPHYFHKDLYIFMAEKSGFKVINFKAKSTIRLKLMEIFAQKVSRPQKLIPKVSYKEILSRINRKEIMIKLLRLPRKIKKRLGLNGELIITENKKGENCET